LTPSKPARFEAAVFKDFAVAARAQVVAAKLRFEELVAVDNAGSDLNLSLRGMASAALAHRLESRVLR
jgi:hypothetical protein